MAEKPFLVQNLSSTAIIQKDPETLTMVSTESSSLCSECSPITSSASQTPSFDFIRKRKLSTQLSPFNASSQVGHRRKRIKTHSLAHQNPSKKAHTVAIEEEEEEEEEESEITQEKETHLTYFRREEKISTQLTLFDESWVPFDYESNNNFKSDFLGPKKFTNVREIIDLSGFRNRPEETEYGVSTELKLYEDPWKIKKKLTKSDCSKNLHRLMFSKEAIERHVKPQLKKHGISDEEIEKGINLRVWDYDTKTEHVLTFKKWVSNNSFIFGSNWKEQFVDRRELQIDEEIGLFWDDNKFRFGVRVLSRAPA